MRCSSVDSGRSQRQARAGVSCTGFHTPVLLRQTLICTYPECSSERHIHAWWAGTVAGSGAPHPLSSDLPPRNSHPVPQLTVSWLSPQELYWNSSFITKYLNCISAPFSATKSPCSFPAELCYPSVPPSRHRQQGPQPGAGWKCRIQVHPRFTESNCT